MSNLTYLRRVGLALLLLGGVSSAWAAATVTGINQVSSTRVGRTTFNYTYTINLTNGTSALSNAVATVTSNAAGTTIVQGTVALGTLAAGASITSTNTFTLQQDRLVPFNPASLIWTVTGTPVDLVPNVVGLTQAAASSAISAAGLVLGTVTQQSSTSVASGNVISESPIAGTQVNQGSAVNLVVSSGGGIGNQINFQAPPPPDPSSVAAALPTNANGQPILLEMQGLQLAIASRPRGPVEGLAVCTRWVAMCVQSAGSLDDCAHSAPVCQTSTPWAESQCCPSACFSNYQSQRLAGSSPIDAFNKIYLTGFCYPGIN